MSKVSVKRHLKELQWRLMIVAAFFITGACLAYSYQAQLIPALLSPLHGEKLVYLNPAGGFSFIFLVSIYAGIALAFPILIQQLYAFLRPALPEQARKKSWKIIVSSFVLLVAGITFGYLVAVPSALTFLYGFADQYVTASLTADSYLNFLIAYTIGIGIVFQLPLLLMLIHNIKPLTPGGLMKSEKWVVLIAFIIAAIITPTPDPINQAIIAGPVVVVYQFGVIAVLLNIAKTRRAYKKAVKRGEIPAVVEPVAPIAPAPTPAPVPARRETLIHFPPVAHAVPAMIDPPLPKETMTEKVLEQAAKTPEAPAQSLIRPLPEPAQPIVKAAPIQQRPVRSIDGFTRPQSTSPLIAPRTAVQPRPRPVVPQRPGGMAPAFYIDSIVAPKRASSF